MADTATVITSYSIHYTKLYEWDLFSLASGGLRNVGRPAPSRGADGRIHDTFATRS